MTATKKAQASAIVPRLRSFKTHSLIKKIPIELSIYALLRNVMVMNAVSVQITATATWLLSLALQITPICVARKLSTSSQGVSA